MITAKRFCSMTALVLFVPAFAWVPGLRNAVSSNNKRSFRLEPLNSAPSMSLGSLHGQNSCFLPLKQLDQDYFAPRIVQVWSGSLLYPSCHLADAFLTITLFLNFFSTTKDCWTLPGIIERRVFCCDFRASSRTRTMDL